MHKLNVIFTLSTLSVLLVTIERFSFTTKILLQPAGYLRLHELVQMVVLILITVLLPFLLLKEVTNNFKTLQEKKGFLIFTAFLIGIYFFATGNGLHEVSSFNFNQFCDTKSFTDNLCTTFFINDYYTGNILYFVGGFLMVVSIMLMEKLFPNTKFSKKDIAILTANAVVYSLAIFAYAAFDRVEVGIIYSIITTLVSLAFFTTIYKKYTQYPVITYTTLTYTIGTVLAVLVRYVW